MKRRLAAVLFTLVMAAACYGKKAVTTDAMSAPAPVAEAKNP